MTAAAQSVITLYDVRCPAEPLQPNAMEWLQPKAVEYGMAEYPARDRQLNHCGSLAARQFASLSVTFAATSTVLHILNFIKSSTRIACIKPFYIPNIPATNWLHFPILFGPYSCCRHAQSKDAPLPPSRTTSRDHFDSFNMFT